MPNPKPTLHLICGRIAAGKTTLAAKLSRSDHTLCISEDDWLSALYGDRMTTVQDYVEVSAKLQRVMAPHVTDILSAGLSVVLDYHANTLENRRWMRACAERGKADVLLHLLDVDEETCWQRLERRNTEGEHPFRPTREQFTQICKHFTPPLPEEGFAIRTHSSG